MTRNVQSQLHRRPNRAEARQILAGHFDAYRKRTFDSLQRLVQAPDVIEAWSSSGYAYYLEFFATWEDRAGGDLRVWGIIQKKEIDGVMPSAQTFLITPNGTILGE
jgi:hypothetical protein